MSTKIRVKLDNIKIDTLDVGLVVAKAGEVYNINDEHICETDIKRGLYEVIKNGEIKNNSKSNKKSVDIEEDSDNSDIEEDNDRESKDIDSEDKDEDDEEERRTRKVKKIKLLKRNK